jgi:hypothetical protein
MARITYWYGNSLWAGWLRVPTSVGAKDFHLFLSDQTDSEAQLVGLFPGSKAVRAWCWPPTHLAQKQAMGRSTPLLTCSPPPPQCQLWKLWGYLISTIPPNRVSSFPIPSCHSSVALLLLLCDVRPWQHCKRIYTEYTWHHIPQDLKTQGWQQIWCTIILVL